MLTSLRDGIRENDMSLKHRAMTWLRAVAPGCAAAPSSIQTLPTAFSFDSESPCESNESPHRILIRSSVVGATANARYSASINGNSHYIASVELDRWVTPAESFPLPDTTVPAIAFQYRDLRSLTGGVCSASTPSCHAQAVPVDMPNASLNRSEARLALAGDIANHWRSYRLWEMRLAVSVPSTPKVTSWKMQR